MANSESSQHPDLQDLVAYLQGRGDEALRAQVLKRLDEDESYLELMVDLVPMLRAAGEIADPDAEEEDGGHVASPSPPTPAAAPLSFVAPPPSTISSPLPANSNVAAHSRRWPAVAALAALVPIAVAVWLVMPRGPLSYRLASAMADDIGKDQLKQANPWEEAQRGGVRGGDGPDTPTTPIDQTDVLRAGGQIFALAITVKNEDLPAAKERLLYLQKWLKDDFAGTYDTVELALKAERFDWRQVDRKMKGAYRDLLEIPEYSKLEPLLNEGVCWRAAWLASLKPGVPLPHRCTNLLEKKARDADTKELETLFDARIEELASSNP